METIKKIQEALDVNPKIQDLFDRRMNEVDREPGAILRSINEQIYPSKAFNNLVERVRKIDENLGDAIANKGINYRAITKDEIYSATGWVETDLIGIDTEKWYSESKELDPNQLDEDIKEKIIDAIYTFREEMVGDIYEYLEREEIEVEDLTKFISEQDFHNLNLISEIQKTEEERWIYFDNQQLAWRADDESIWEYINNNRGHLIWWEQISNDDDLPNFIYDELIYTIY